MLYYFFLAILCANVSVPYEDRTQCSKTSADEIQTPGNHPKERIQHSQHGESLKSRIFLPTG